MTHHLYILTGASRGMGRAMAEQLLAPGHHLLCISRTADVALQQRADGAGVPLLQWQHDLADGAPLAERLARWLRDSDPRAWAGASLVNNAGMIPPVVPLRDAASADTAHALRVGLEAPMLLTTAFLHATRAWTVPRKVLNISSGLGRRPMASQAGYCTAKAGMDMFTRCAALDEALLPHGAKLCALAPGVVDTDMQHHLRSADAAAFPDRARFEGLHTGAQLTSPADAAAQVLAYLARPDFGAEPVADVRA